QVGVWRDAGVFAVRDPPVAGRQRSDVGSVSVRIVGASLVGEVFAVNDTHAIRAVQERAVIGVDTRIEYRDADAGTIEGIVVVSATAAVAAADLVRAGGARDV